MESHHIVAVGEIALLGVYVSDENYEEKESIVNEDSSFI
jgi:hypothetical protein